MIVPRRAVVVPLDLTIFNLFVVPWFILRLLSTHRRDYRGEHKSIIEDLKLWYVVVGVQSVHLGILAFVGTVLDHRVRAGDRYTVHLVSGVAFFYGFSRYIRLFGI